MNPDSKRKQVNGEQLTALLDFLKEHQELAKGLTRGLGGKFHTVKSWNLCAKKLNTIKDGAVKDGKAWSKYWCDIKYRVRRRALQLKVARDNNRPPPDGLLPLSSKEETILSIIGDNAVDGVVIKRDPLGDEDTDIEELDNMTRHNEAPGDPFYSTRSTRSSNRKRRHSNDHIEWEARREPSTPPVKKHEAARSNGDVDESDPDDDASKFLRLEQEKLDNTKRIATSVESISTTLTRFVDVMIQIRDILMNNRINF